MKVKATDRPDWQRGVTAVMEHVSDLNSLKKHLTQGASLVALDTESYGYLKNGRTCPSNEVSELGFATLEWPCPDLELCTSSKDFALRNNAKLLNIQLRQRTCKHVESTLSPIVHATGVKEAEETIRYFLPESSKRILGYALSTEFKWIAMHCPGLAKSFAAWVDVQELVMQHYGKLALVVSSTTQRSGPPNDRATPNLLISLQPHNSANMAAILPIKATLQSLKLTDSINYT